MKVLSSVFRKFQSVLGRYCSCCAAQANNVWPVDLSTKLSGTYCRPSIYHVYPLYVSSRILNQHFFSFRQIMGASFERFPPLSFKKPCIQTWARVARICSLLYHAGRRLIWFAVHCIVDGKIILATYADLWSRGQELICIIDVIIHRRVPCPCCTT